jgi:type IV pilus assembly protein PilM
VDVDLIPVALSRLLLSRTRTPGTVALVDIGVNTSTVVIATDGVPQSR